MNSKEENSVWISSKNSAPEIADLKKAKVFGIIMSCFIVQHVRYTEQVVHSLLIKRKRRAFEAAANPTNMGKATLIPYFLCPSFVFGLNLFHKKFKFLLIAAIESMTSSFQADYFCYFPCKMSHSSRPLNISTWLLGFLPVFFLFL